MKERGSWAPAACRKAATAERRKVGREARRRETCVLGRSGPSAVVELEAGVGEAKRLRGTAQAMGSPASRLKRA
jgi:hypothetical protein